jgi:putative oxidoreductase
MVPPTEEAPVTDTLATAPGAPMQRLADQLSSLTPPDVAAQLARARPSPAVDAAIKRSAQVAAMVAARAQRARNRSFIASIVDSFVLACAFVPYALVALVLRLVIARVFFLSGQTMITGPRVPVNVQDFFSFSVVLPFEVKASTFDMFLTHYSAVPMPPVIAAYLASYASFVLPLMLVLGLGTRIAALGLLIMTAMIIIVMPEALWATHVYWGALLLVLLSQGPGVISVDHIVRYVTRR